MHDLPYRRRLERAQSLRRMHLDDIQDLPSLRRGPGQQVEVHMLCGRDQYDMGIAASWSLMRFLPGAVLYLHSDGTLEDSHVAQWRQVIEALEFVPKDDADKRVREELLPELPLLSTWRDTNWAAYQLTDYSLFGDSRVIISCDSDVLCLREPTYLLDHLATPAMLWNEDVRTSYSLPAADISEVTQLPVPPRLNCGFGVMPRVSRSDLEEVEQALRLLLDVPGFDLNHMWSSQTYVALVAARQKGARALPADYSVYYGRTRPETVVRHYVGVPSVRSRFFDEGLPMLIEQSREWPRNTESVT